MICGAPQVSDSLEVLRSTSAIVSALAALVSVVLTIWNIQKTLRAKKLERQGEYYALAVVEPCKPQLEAFRTRIQEKLGTTMPATLRLIFAREELTEKAAEFTKLFQESFWPLKAALIYLRN